ncbi:MAG TPA: hypothetical protein PLZ52_08000 [Bacteroidales bacterium]|nr:hypothetical protein [Bacteroidales bacterium]HQL69229.1 hypothetical protein [Bacteroidales bacterium]
MKIIEILLWVLTIVVYLIHLFIIPEVLVLLNLFLHALSLFYFLLGFASFNGATFNRIFKKETYAEAGPLGIVATAGSGYSLSLVVIGILFKLMHYPGSKVMLYAGLFFLLGFNIVSLIRFLQNRYPGFLRILIRTILIGGFGLYLIIG